MCPRLEGIVYHCDYWITFNELKEFFHFLLKVRGPYIADLGLGHKEQLPGLDLYLLVGVNVFAVVMTIGIHHGVSGLSAIN